MLRDDAMKHKTRENVIIYGSLLLAIILVIYVAKTYYDNRDNSEEVFKELNQVFIKEKQPEEPKKEATVEPDKIRFIDKRPIITEYLDEILNRKISDNILTYDKVFSWGEFEITDIKFYKKITDTYYSYIVNIKVNNREADVSGLSDKNLSTSEYYIVSVKFYFVYDNDSISIKNVEYNK